MKKNGFSLLEIIVVTAIMGIVMLIFSPMINAFIGAQDRLYNQSKVDSRLNEVVEFIKRDVRNARSDGSGGELVEVTKDPDDNWEKIIMYSVDSDGVDTYIQYLFKKSDNQLFVDTATIKTELTTGRAILSDVEEGEFKYQDRILLFYFKIDVPERLKGKNGEKDKIRNEVRDVAITRINLQ